MESHVQMARDPSNGRQEWVSVPRIRVMWIALAALVGLSCDGSINVSGTIVRSAGDKAALCQVTLWYMGGPFWAPATPRKRRTAAAAESFSLHWTIAGPRSEHWVEVSCPGYEVFRSARFEAPSTVRKRDFGVIRLKPRARESKAR